jgi:hypothetical protein
MIPAALIGILAVNRLGAIHAVVFGGFASGALAQRIEASRPVAILTASCGIEGTKAPVSYRGFVEEAIRISSWKPPRAIIWSVSLPPFLWQSYVADIGVTDKEIGSATNYSGDPPSRQRARGSGSTSSRASGLAASGPSAYPSSRQTPSTSSTPAAQPAYQRAC